MTNYDQLTGVGKGLQQYGGGIKILGFVVALLGGLGFVLIGGEARGAFMTWARGFALVGGCLFGVALHWAGTVAVALGEAMLPLRDIAMNTSKTSEAVASGAKSSPAKMKAR